MPRGDKDAYTDKQKRKAGHIEQGYEKRGTPKDEAERRGRQHPASGDDRLERKR